MPNIKSAKKRVLLTKAYALRNSAAKSEVKTAVRKFNAALASGDDATTAFTQSVSKIDRAVKKGVMHKNTAARKKSKLAVKLNAANAAK